MPLLNPNACLITGVICGYRVEEIENPLTQQVRYLDKLVDELAKGREDGEDFARIIGQLLNLDSMNPKKIWANFAVTDLKRTTKFYTELGFKPNGIHSSTDELTSFLFGKDNFVIHFFKKDILQTNIRSEIVDSEKSNEIIFTLSAKSKKQVDKWAKQVESAGGKIISRPEEFGKGYYGFIFADPDGHRFNIFYMEGL